MTKITKIKKYAIQWLHSQNFTIKQISKEVSLTENQVLSVLNTEPKVTTDSSPSIKAKDLMITHTSGKRVNNVSIMTKEASEMGDALKTSHSTLNPTQLNKAIYRPKK
jgi:orotate phosphoribosyltransferase-like protein